MPPRLESLLKRPIGFAHRGAKAHARDNTIEAFELAAKLGATGMETDVFLTYDGVPVLDHDGVVGGFLRKEPISDIPRSALPEHIPSLAEFYDRLGTEWPLSVDVKDPAAFDAIIGTARDAGGSAEDQLWLCHPEFHQLISWREHTSAKLVNSTRVNKMKEGPERRAARLRDLGIDAVNLRQNVWTGGMIALFHRFDRFALGWDAQHPRQLANLLDMGIDMFGVVADIPHRQYLGEKSAAGGYQFPTVYRWLAELTLLDRGSTDVQVAVQDLQAAGLPLLDQGTQLDFVGGMYEPVRYRLAGTLTRISITGLYDVRLTVEWQLYDTETGSTVFTGSSDGFSRGTNLGLTGMRPNAMLDSFQDCLGKLLGQAEFTTAMATAGDQG